MWAVNVLIRPGAGPNPLVVVKGLEAAAGPSSGSGAAIRDDGSVGSVDVSWYRDSEDAATKVRAVLEVAAHELPDVELEMFGPFRIDDGDA